MRPHLLALRSTADEVRKNQRNSKEADRKIEKDFKALRVSEMKARYSDVPEDHQYRTSSQDDKPRKICGA
jgi:hypothetical protein